MMKRRLPTLKAFFIAILLFFCSIGQSFSQNISTEGTDFWLGYMPHINLFQLELSIFISAQDSVNGIISIPGNPDTTFTVLPNSTTEIAIASEDWFDVVSFNPNLVQPKGIHIVTDNKVSVYALNKRVIWSADATNVLPTVSLGKEYYAIAHTDGVFTANDTTYSSLPASILVVGTEDNTQIEVTPSADLIGGNSSGVAFTISLDEGETYLLQSNADLTGTRLRTVNGSSGDCSNFAVFSGSERSYVGQCGAGQDHLIQQMYPLQSWGKEFVYMPFQNRLDGDLVKVVASEDNTTVNISGEAPVTLNAGEFYSNLLDSIRTITADKPIGVAQFSRSARCDGSLGDPFMIGLSPNEQLLKKITFSAFPVFSPDDFIYYVDIITPTAGIDIIELDSVGIAASFNPVPGNPDLSYAQIPNLDTGNHIITSDSGFVAYVYGFGINSNAFESFGYVTGASLANVNYQIFSVDSGQVNIQNTSTLCFGNVNYFSSDIDDSFLFFNWDMGDGTTYTTKEVAHVFPAPGEYVVTLVASTSLGDCGSQETITKVVTVQTPEYEIRGPQSVCPNTFLIDYFIVDAGADDYTYSWSVSGGTIVTGQNSDSIKVNWLGTNPNAFVQVTTTDNLGCSSTKTLNVDIETSLNPAAPIGPDSICYNDLTHLYEAIYANGNEYEWFIEGGTFIPDGSNANGNGVIVTWDTTATEWKLWFNETNILDTVCAGVSDTFFLSAILPELVVELAVDQISCFGEDDGVITVLPSGGSGNYLITWAQDTSLHDIVLDSLMPGIYEVTVLDTFGCSVISSAEIIEPDTLTLTFAQTDAICFGEASGTIDVTVSGGVKPYQYNWGSSSVLDTNYLGAVSQGDYQVVVTDSNNCQITSPIIVVNQPDSMQFEIVGADSVCQFTNKDYTVIDDEDDIYTWFVTGGTLTMGQGTKNVSIDWGETTTEASIKVVSENAQGCISDTLVFDVEIFQLEQPAVPLGPDTLCFFDTLAISYEAPLVTGYAYNWFIDGGTFTVDGSVPAGNVISVDWELSGEHKLWYQVVVIDDPMCTAYSDTLEVDILTFNNTPPEVAVSINDLDTIYCDTLYLGESLNFQVSGADVDNDFLRLIAEGRGFNIVDYGIQFNEVTGVGTVDQSFVFDVNCDPNAFPNPTQLQEELLIDFIVSDSVGCLVTDADTATIKIILIKEARPDALPSISTIIADYNASTRTYTINATIGDAISFDVTALDASLNEVISISAIGQGFELTDVAMEFVSPSGASPQSATFNWLVDCSHLEIANSFTIRFLVEDAPNLCGVSGTDEVFVVINLGDIDAGSFDPPNAFSPNGDGIGDEYYINNLPQDNCSDRFSSVKIYNRWGKLVFESTDRNFRWKGLDVPSGVYFAEVHYENSTYKVRVAVFK